VHDTALVRVFERFGDIAQDADRIPDWQRPVAAQSRPQRLALDEWHRIEGHPRGLAGGENGDDLRVLELRRELNLPFEAVSADPSRQLGREHLHNDAAPERLFDRDEDTRHPAAPKLPLEGVRRTEGGLELVA
jgi:hypothetical protein